MYAQHFVFLWVSLKSLLAKERLLVEAVGRVREQVPCPRYPAGRGCEHPHLAQGVWPHAGLPNQQVGVVQAVNLNLFS